MSAIICAVNRRGNAAKLRKTRDIIMRGNIVTSALLVILTTISVFIIFWYKKEQKELKREEAKQKLVRHKQELLKQKLAAVREERKLLSDMPHILVFRDNENILFSRPNFYGEIADNIGICDIERLRQTVKSIGNAKEYDVLKKLISDENREFPVVVFVASDDYWVEKFDVDYFAYLVGYYAHIKRVTTEELAEQFAKDYDLDEDEYRDSITVFYPGKKPAASYKSHILNTTFEVIKIEKKKYWNETGCRAFRRQLVSDIRENNVVK